MTTARRRRAGSSRPHIERVGHRRNERTALRSIRRRIISLIEALFDQLEALSFKQGIAVLLVLMVLFLVFAFKPTQTHTRAERERERVIFTHLHMAKSAGTTINALLAHNYERVCGHKGYSYDAHQANVRHKEAGGGHIEASKDSFSKRAPYSRLTVPEDFMDEIGYEDCDWISHEILWGFWPRLVNNFKAYDFTVEMHVPCREPVDHLMSNCNFQGKNFDCTATDLEEEVKQCLAAASQRNWFLSRFSKKLLKVDGLTLQCFNPMPPNRYIEYMGNQLQRKRIDGGEFVHRSTNRPRNKAEECIWSDDNAKVREEVVRLLMKEDYFSWCHECLGSDRDLFH